MTAAGLDPMVLLASLPLEDGTLWGSRAEGFQRADAAAFLDRSVGAPRRHYQLRGRGMSKSSDAAGLGLVSTLTDAPPRSRSHIFAVDSDQAGLLMDAVGGFIQRGNLGSLVEVTGRSITNRATDASLTVEASDGASAYGLRPWAIYCDELSMWPATPNHRRLWAALVSAVPKVPVSRMLCIGTAGSPGSLGHEVWKSAQTSPMWRTSLNPGPAPWWTAEDVAATRASLTASEYRRLIECEWAESDDALTTVEDVEACIRAGETTLPPRLSHSYVACLDIGTRRDLSAFVIGHLENRAAGRVVVVDVLRYWRPGKGLLGRVDLSEVEGTVLRLCKEYGVDRLRNDRMQAEQLTMNVAREGVRVEEYVFSAAGASKVARSLHLALRDRSVELPDDDELRAEGASVRMVETGPGTVKMSNPAGTHDDVLTVIGMLVADLTAQPDYGDGRVSSLAGVSLTAVRARAAGLGVPTERLLPASYRMPMRGALADVARSAKDRPAMRARGDALVAEGTVNDPSRANRNSRA